MLLSERYPWCSVARSSMPPELDLKSIAVTGEKQRCLTPPPCPFLCRCVHVDRETISIPQGSEKRKKFRTFLSTRKYLGTGVTAYPCCSAMGRLSGSSDTAPMNGTGLIKIL